MCMEKSILTFCKSCGAIFSGNRWLHEKSMQSAISDILLSRGYREFTVRNMGEAESLIRSGEKEVRLELGFRDRKRRESVHLKISYSHCRECSRAKSGYYEGILQLRNRKNADFENILDSALSRIDARKNVFVAKTVESKDGIDLYLSSNRFMASLGKWLNENYGGELKSSRKLFTRSHETGKEVFRVTVLVRLPDFSAGDIIMAGKRYLLVKAVKAKAITGSDLVTGKSLKQPYANPEKIIQKSSIREAVVSRTKPHLEVLHPDSYQPTKVQNERLVNRDRLRVVEIEGKLYMVSNNH